jgi:UDP-N-acetylglucosamine--N-acetylmuramyl-(pentapeptide) pyrophosphoryl-undecaprenol N-acetylglucosamine transferase
MTISEINYVGVPAIYSPYPFAANDHQMKNARASERAGGSITIADEELTGEKLIETISELYADPDRLAGMAKCSARSWEFEILRSGFASRAEHLLVQRIER